ncbi:bifunctional 3-deoxy-7-phosphoheptulonate synthase/chorismate mutase type II [Tenuifilum thalassicum]|uniref:chorismate mutase n=1 Tax=Tenuifilum thalassicum TaxID=2590900 RepID=A0A7D3Y5G3_9BACT|nr:bifunctional 3-deoxy-7-phosphoheptulonate synthase/chorismate mutase type II [Tenuifilum thalassicum]QKG80609.1 3-deoxy-7-phosphoheptulonate synthase [Tenuifilum thalassicum]
MKCNDSREGSKIRRQQPLIIAGPCSAESPQQLLSVANELKRNGKVSYMRAGVWKPRTTPNSFEGYGSEALEWLKEVRQETGMPFATEVANEKHVYEALKFGADLLWIGARTVSNPFAVQEIAVALRGVHVPVLVKNPLSPDLKLWEGAINRLRLAGVNEVGAVHRGFTMMNSSPFRNFPMWEVALQLKANNPELMVLSDPSHISGNSAYIEILSRRALSLGFNGLMIEVHPNPQIALSDAKQQITPNQFNSIINSILNKDNTDEDIMAELRTEIDALDEMLVWALSNRMAIATEIAKVKSQTGKAIIQPDRWNDVLAKVIGKGFKMGLRTEFIKNLYNSIHRESLQAQEALANQKNEMMKIG